MHFISLNLLLTLITTFTVSEARARALPEANPAPAAEPAPQFPGFVYDHKSLEDPSALTPNMDKIMHETYDPRDTGDFRKREFIGEPEPKVPESLQHDKRTPEIFKWRWSDLMDGIERGVNAFL